jgi:hypothetical protein
MKKILKILVCLSLIVPWVIAGPETAFSSLQKAVDEKWISYATDEDGIEYFYSPKRIQNLPGNLVRVWVKAVYPEKQSKFQRAELLWEIDCTKKSLRGISAKTTKKDGTPANLTKPSMWSDIPAGSTAESLCEAVCKKPKNGK